MGKEIEFKKGMLKEPEKRVKFVNTWIEKKNWENVRSGLDSQVYNMRGTMNYLAASQAGREGGRQAVLPGHGGGQPPLQAQEAGRRDGGVQHDDLLHGEIQLADLSVPRGGAPHKYSKK